MALQTDWKAFAAFVCCLFLTVILLYLQVGFYWISGLISFLALLRVLLGLVGIDLTMVLKAARAPPLPQPELFLEQWEERGKRITKIRAFGSEALPYVDGMSKSLLDQSTPASGGIAQTIDLMKEEKYDEADAKAKHIIQVIQSDAREHTLELGQLYLIRGDAAFNTGQFVEAERFYNMSHELATVVKDDFLIMASSNGIVVAKGSQGRHSEALAALDQILTIQSSARVWSNKGAALGRLGRYEEALKACDEAIKLDPRDSTAWANKGVALGNLGRYEETLKAYDEAIKLNPTNAIVWSSKGEVLRRSGRPEEALKACDEATRLNPKYAAAWTNKGLALGSLGRHEEALKACDEAIKVNSRDAIAWTAKGATLGRLGRYEEALKACDEAIKLNPGNTVALTNKGLTLICLNRQDEAIRTLEEAIQIDPTCENARQLKQWIESRVKS